MRKLVALSVVVISTFGATSTAQAKSKTPLIDATDKYIAATHHRQQVMGVQLTRTNYSYKRSPSAKYKRWVHDYWKRVNWRVLQQYRAPPHFQQWMCIHSHEAGSAWTGQWKANTGNGYYGGLQMDYGFQSYHGGYLLAAKGTANNWTPLEQMWVAEDAHRTRGFYPWPNTARYCGLI